MSTPSACSARAVDTLSPPRPSPSMLTSPSPSAPNSSARCEIDLSPGTRQAPRSGPERRACSVEGGGGAAGACSSGGDGGDITACLSFSVRGDDSLQDEGDALRQQVALGL